MDLGLSALFLHCMHAIYIQMSQSWLLSQSRYVKSENPDMSKFSQSLRPTNWLTIIYHAMNTIKHTQFLTQKIYSISITVLINCLETTYL